MNFRHLHGVLLLLSALLLFATIDTSIKYLSAFVAVPLLLWLRFFVHMALMLAVVAPRVGWQLVATRRPWLSLVRALTLVGSSLLLQLAFKRMPLAETTSLFFVTPLIVAGLAGPILGERLRLRTWLVIGTGFLGALLVARPGGALVGEGVALTLAAALCYAIYQILTRKLSATEPVMRQLFYTALVGTLAMSPVLAVYRFDTSLLPWQWALMLSLGVLAGIGHFLFIRAFQNSPASSLSPMMYFQLVWVSLLGWLVFGHYPDASSALGMLVIVGSGVGLIPRRR